MDYFSVWCVTISNQDLKLERLIFSPLNYKILFMPSTLYCFNNYVWFVYSTMLGAEKTILNKMYVIVAFYTVHLAGQIDNHTSSHGESTGLVNHSDFPKCVLHTVEALSLFCTHCKYYFLLIWFIVYCIGVLCSF